MVSPEADRAEQALELGHLPVHLLGDAVEADQERGAAAQAEAAQRLAVGQLERARE